MNHKRFAVSALCTIFVFLQACKPSAPDVVNAVAEHAQPAPFEIVEVIAGAPFGDGPPPHPVTVTTPIEVVILTKGHIESAKLRIKLINLSNGLAVGDSFVSLNKDSEREQSIRFESDSRWEAGRHLIEITLDDKIVRHQDLDIYLEDTTPEGPVK